MKWLHNLLKGATLTTALFIFQACYGIRQDPLYEEHGEAPMSFTIVSDKTGEPLEGIHILSNPTKYSSSYNDIGVTGINGKCQVELFYYRNQEGPFLRFEDPHGVYAVKDTSLTDLRQRNILITLKSLQ